MKKYNATPGSLFGLLICGLILIIAGAWMYITHQEAAGNVSGRGTGTMFGHINGLYIVIFGAVLAVIPLYIISKGRKK